MSPNDNQFMQRALRLAGRGLFTTEPNPRVGCVLVRDGVVVGEGWHRRAGGPHAEVAAIRAADGNTAGCTAYVTLEPCCHTGKTGPCTQALIDAGITRVVAAMQDPNPLVAGKGLNLLAEHGIETEVGLLEVAARALNPGFISRMERGRPFVRLKMAMSMDGRTAMATGESRWITSDAARADVQRMRARSSAILTGIGTVTSDDPRLDVRVDAQDLGLDEGELNRPLRVVLDSQGRLSSTARLFDTSGEVLQVTAPGQGGCEAAQHVEVDTVYGRLDLVEVMLELARREINEVHAECGPTLAGSLMLAGLVDELVLYVAPHIMGDNARGLFTLPGLEEMADRIALNISDTRMVGSDMRITACVES